MTEVLNAAPKAKPSTAKATATPQHPSYPGTVYPLPKNASLLEQAVTESLSQQKIQLAATTGHGVNRVTLGEACKRGLPRMLVSWNSLGVARSTTNASRTRRETLQQRDKSKEPPCGWSDCCSRTGEAIVIKRRVKPTINEAELMGWIDEECGKEMSPNREARVRSYPHNSNGMRVSSRENGNTSHVVDKENRAWTPFFKRGVPCDH